MRTVAEAVAASGGSIGRGQVGPQVVLVQAALAADGIPVDQDGIFGTGTTAAVRRYQRAHGLSSDGYVGPLTATRMDESLAFRRPAEPERAKEPLPSEKAVWPRQGDVERFFGPVGQNQTTLVLPWAMKLAWDKKQTVFRLACHEKVHDSALRCFQRIGDAYDEKARADLGIDLFGGCLNVRKMRGGSAWSMHSWGIAIDFDPARNQLHWGRDRARLAKPDAETFWRIWEDEGWRSLGRTRNYDWMHVEAARL